MQQQQNNNNNNLGLSFILVHSVVINLSFESQRNGQLIGTTFTFSKQEASIDARAQQVLSLAARDGAMEPRKLVKRVERGDV